MKMSSESENVDNESKVLTETEKKQLEIQSSRLVPEFKVKQLENSQQKHWDLFYKRNETRFFKDRRWTTREFEELLSEKTAEKKHILEVGCGVGNFLYPLIEENRNNFYYYACDFSPRAIEFVKKNPLYNEDRVKAFQCDITNSSIFNNIEESSLDIITMIFVLSAIHPDKFINVIENLSKLLRPDGVLLFRDYGLYDMTQLRFKPGHKILENFYMRQDGTTTYFFQTKEIENLFSQNNFEIVENSYIHNRRTLNIKEGIDVPRIFIQSKFKKKNLLN